MVGLVLENHFLLDQATISNFVGIYKLYKLPTVVFIFSYFGTICL
jgi:hypothetical protein